MTTITVDAYQGIMCSDSHWTDQSSRGPARKVFRINGALVGLAGSLGHFEEALEHIRLTGGSKLHSKCDVTALILDGRRVKTWAPVDGLLDAPSRYAIGGGGDAARGAMMAGASARKALAIAKEIDANTSGRTRVYKLRNCR